MKEIKLIMKINQRNSDRNISKHKKDHVNEFIYIENLLILIQKKNMHKIL